MFYGLGLIATVAICGWLALDLVTSTGARRRSLSVACMAASAGIWAGGDLLMLGAENAAQELFARRVNYIGISALPLAFFAVAVQAARPRWWSHAGAVFAAASVIPILTYSCLFWDSAEWFVDYSVHPPRRGPFFYAHLLYSWGMIGASWFYFWRTAQRLRRASRSRLFALAAGVGVPLVANFLHIIVFPDLADATPVLLAFGAVCVRLAVIDSGLALYLPLARADVLEQVAVGIAVADLEGNVVDANRAARVLAGCADPIGHPLAGLIEGATRRTDLVIEARSVPLRSTVAEVGTAVLFEDRTASRHAEQRLQLAARLESLGFLTAGIAHEVNNPLAFIRANLSQLEKLACEVADPAISARLSASGQPIAEDARELVSDTQEGVERIAALVQRLKAFARNESTDSARVSPVDLGRVADKAIAMASVGLPGDAIRRVGAAPAPIFAVEGDLVQIALNLLVNAVQASEDGVDIEVEVAESADGVALVVRDRGTGIDCDALPHLFEPFYTTKPQGTGSGLGLSLSNDLANRYGGRLTAENREGGGAAFTLWIPIER